MSQYLSPIHDRRTPPAPRAGGRDERRWRAEADEPEPSLAPLDLRQVLAMLRRRVWLVLGVTAAAVAGAWAYAKIAAPVYQATAVVQLTDERRELTGRLGDQDQSAPSSPSTDPVLSEVAVLTSRNVVGNVIDSMPTLRLRTQGFGWRSLVGFTIVEPVVDSAGLPPMALAFGERSVTVVGAHGERVTAPYGSPIELDGVRFAVASRPKGRKGTLTVLRREDASARLAASIKTKARENTNIVDVSYASVDPARAQRVVNTLLRVFQAASVEDASREARLRRQFVEEQLRQNDSVLGAARLALSDFRGRQRSFSAREKFTAQRSDLSGLQARQDDLDAQRRMYASVLRQLQSSAQGGAAARDGVQQLGALLSAQGASASTIVMDQYVTLQRLQSTRDSLTTGRWASAPTNPDVQRVDALIATARVRLERTVEGIVATLDERRTALAREQARSSAELEQLPTSDAEEAQLVEREEAYRKSSDQLREELQRARLAEAAAVGQVGIVDLAALPRIPMGVPFGRKLLYGVLLGLFLGTGVALVAEHLNTAIRGREDLESVLQLPGLAVIPKFDARRGRLARGRGRARLPGARGGGGGGGGRGAAASGNGGDRSAEPVSRSLVTVHDARSVSAEAYRTLRTKLLFSQAISSLRTILVTSPFAQEGKSTVAANLAATFAQHGMRVLLVDCDLRRPSQHAIFHVSEAPGLTELLEGEGAVAGTGRRTPIEGLSLITAGAVPDDPAEVIGSTRMRTVLARLEESFDVVVLDTPPVLPVADTSILASMADGVLLVVHAGKTHRRAAQLAVQQLQDVDARILGAVLNDPNARVPLYDSYGYASYYAYVHGRE